MDAVPQIWYAHVASAGYGRQRTNTSHCAVTRVWASSTTPSMANNSAPVQRLFSTRPAHLSAVHCPLRARLRARKAPVHGSCGCGRLRPAPPQQSASQHRCMRPSRTHLRSQSRKVHKSAILQRWHARRQQLLVTQQVVRAHTALPQHCIRGCSVVSKSCHRWRTLRLAARRLVCLPWSMLLVSCSSSCICCLGRTNTVQAAGPGMVALWLHSPLWRSSRSHLHT